MAAADSSNPLDATLPSGPEPDAFRHPQPLGLTDSATHALWIGPATDQADRDVLRVSEPLGSAVHRRLLEALASAATDTSSPIRSEAAGGLAGRRPNGPEREHKRALGGLPAGADACHASRYLNQHLAVIASRHRRVLSGNSDHPPNDCSTTELPGDALRTLGSIRSASPGRLPTVKALR